MGMLTPQLLLGIEDRMSILASEGAAMKTLELWWKRVATERQSTGRREFLMWVISTAMIRDLGKSAGNLSFSDLNAIYTEIENKFAGEGFEVTKADLEDSDGGGIDKAAEWATQIGVDMAYFPQRKVAHALMNGHTLALYPSYDGLPLFSANHLVNPTDASVGTFHNIFTGAASGSYPGACPIHDGVATDTALTNLGKIRAYIKGIKAPNGVDPRGLKPTKILCGPQMYPRVAQLTSAKVLPQIASSGAGSADVEPIIQTLGYGRPIEVEELYGFESDTTFFVVAEGAAPSALGPIVYQNREPFRMSSYGPNMADHELGRKQSFEWHVHGRNAVAAGHPYLIFKCQAT